MRKYRMIDNFGDEVDVNPKKSFVKLLLFGLIWYPLAIGLFTTIDEWEVNGGSHSFNVVTGMLYALAGKWGVLIGLMMIGNICLYMAYKKYLLIKTYAKRNNPMVNSELANKLVESGIEYESNYDFADAKRIYEYVIQEFRTSDAAKKARFRLEGIKKNCSI